ncbi:nitrilase-related carbon-nitrogen hydrolase [Sporomusa sphaeroides]|uniref:nitrilase-related carbon-nitrogen hydrolase n=2 Tax=Sporomusa sphaeroides TaxID=47679 RepID=UPI002C8BC42A|nr:nitrilase-related carbon-nitrogen hydrolase [Sporomusa sphaeroides]HML32309.1 hypothetical protein [Sporomusa sphaeroides]
MKIFSLTNLQKAYRKYKSMIYYDTYGAIDREKIADFEVEHDIHKDDNYFKELAKQLADQRLRDEMFLNIISKIDVRCYPKKVKMSSISGNKYDEVISNALPENNIVESVQYQIDFPIEGHILGILWVIEYGTILDSLLIDNCFGNRLKPYIRKESEKVISPFLFEPYFKKYESWRDGALDIAQQQLDEKKDVLTISLDIKSYYYFARINFDEIKQVLYETIINNNEDSEKAYVILTDFVECVFKKYSSLFSFTHKESPTDDLPFIPIGFAPSMVIANWYLNDFDRKVLNDLHPIYYGRYVDDFLLVIPYYQEKESLTKVNEVIDKYFTDDKGYSHHSFFIKPDDNDNNADKQDAYFFADKKYQYLSVQMEKFKVYIFKHDASRAIINKFRKEIQRNSSEFRYMFEKDQISKHIDDEIYKIDYDGTINKIRSINGIGIDKFRLSKTLSKLIYASVENGYKDRPKMFAILSKAFCKGSGIDLFTLWEKVITLLFMQKCYVEIRVLIDQLNRIIENVTFERDLRHIPFWLQANNDESVLKETLKKTLLSSLYRVLALRRNDQVIELEDYIRDKFGFPKDSQSEIFNELRKKFLISQLINTKITMVPIRNYGSWNTSEDYDLIFGYADNQGQEGTIKYFPRYTHLHECFLHSIDQIIRQDKTIEKTEYFKDSTELYQQINYMYNHDASVGKEFFSVTTCPCAETDGIYQSTNNKICNTLRKGDACARFYDRVRINKISVGKGKYSSLRVGIASVQIKEKNIKDAWVGRPNISVDRMDELIEIVNSAAKHKVQILIMPECYVPYCWTGQIIEAARKHNMAMVFGIEHIVQRKTAYNYLMTVLPVVVEGYNNCVVKMRLKNFYAPAEVKGIQDHHLTLPDRVNTNYFTNGHEREYDLFSWNGINFAPYNCFELTHIYDRALFKSEIDLLIACEDNKDTGYFANIIDSLALDLHCYCVQVNASQYGDSKIAQPKGSHEKTILSIKGGDNVFLIVGNVNINSLREFQICENSSNAFKPLPPGFNFKRVRKRMGLE